MEQWVSPRRGETIRMKQLCRQRVPPATCARARLQPAVAAVLGRPAQAWTHVALSSQPAGGWARGEGPWGAGWEGGMRGSWGPLRPQQPSDGGEKGEARGKDPPQSRVFWEPVHSGCAPSTGGEKRAFC